MSRIGSLTHNNQILFFLGEAMNRVNERQIQISSGKIAEHFSGIPDKASLLVSLKNSIDQSNKFKSNISSVDDRLQTMEGNIRQLQEIAIKAQTTLVSATTTENASAMGLNNLAKQLMEQASAFLNLQMDGRYLFGGTITDKPPVDITKTPFVNGTPSVYPTSADTSYYQGNDTIHSIRADISYTIQYGVTAKDSGFEKLMRALNMASTTNVGPPSDKLRLEEALQMANEATAEIPLTLSKIGGVRLALENILNKHQDYTVLAENQVAGIENVDVTDAVARLSQDQTALEASYATLARLSNLSLAKYL